MNDAGLLFVVADESCLMSIGHPLPWRPLRRLDCGRQLASLGRWLAVMIVTQENPILRPSHPIRMNASAGRVARFGSGS